MARFGNLVGTLGLVVIASHASAQSNGIPAEFPPATFSGNQYVDSEGCAFIRAGISGITNWVPRVDRTRTMLCNFQPTFALAEPAPEPEVEPVEAPEIIAEAPAAATEDVGAPIETVASIPATTTPLVQTPTQTQIATFRPVPTPASVPQPEVAPAPAPISMAEACEGRFGVQTGFVSSTTGEPIDCGPAPQVAEAVAPEPRRMTLADACAEIARTGQIMIDAATSRPLVCPNTQRIATATAPSIAVPAGPAGPATAAAPASPTTAQIAQACGGAIEQMRTVNGLAVRCGPQNQRPYTVAGGTERQAQTTRAKTTSLESLFQQPTVPASNPIAPANEVIRRPAGYQNVWSDGRLNPNRGLPQRQEAPAVGVGHSFVQVGMFGDHNNAQRLGQRLVAMGLPVGLVNRGGMKMVVSGPFSDPAALQQALATVRGLGFSDAYTRN